MGRHRDKKKPHNRKRGGHKQQPGDNAPPAAAPQVAVKTVGQPPGNAVETSTRDDKATDDSKQKISRRERLFFAWSEVILAAAIMIATVAQAVIGKFQWDAMQVSTEQTRETIRLLRHEQRADIFIGAPVIKDFVAEKKIEFYIPLINAGGRAGIVTHMGYTFIISELTPDIPDEISRLAFNSLFLGDRHLEVFKENARRIAGEVEGYKKLEVDAVKSGTKSLRVLVAMDFADPFGGQKMVWRCFKYGPDSGEFYVEDEFSHDDWIDEADAPEEEPADECQEQP
jgi:hypothetical protein